jgi:hypothetical protein
MRVIDMDVYLMDITKKSAYIIKQSNGTTWCFFFQEKQGITYKVLQEAHWSKSLIIAESYSANFSVVLLSDDSIQLIYKDTEDNIITSIFSGGIWRKYPVLQNQNKDMFQTYLNALLYNYETYIFYSVLNSKTKVNTILYQKLDNKRNLSTPIVIDTITSDCIISFSLHISDLNHIYIIYEKPLDTYELGYKVLKLEETVLSNFFCIDKNPYPFIDYSLISMNNILHLVYIKKYKGSNMLMYCCSNDSILKHYKIHENLNMSACSIFMSKDHICCLWLQGHNIYSSFSINGGLDFIFSSFNESLTPSQTMKSIYLSNISEEKEDLALNEFFINIADNLECLILASIYPHINPIGKKNTYIAQSMQCIMKDYDKYSKQKSEEINELKLFIEKQKLKVQSLENKLTAVNGDYIKFKEGKKLLDENINFFQESLIDKEKQLNEMSNLMIKKENEILMLKEEILALKDKINELVLNNKSSFFSRFTKD